MGRVPRIEQRPIESPRSLRDRTDLLFVPAGVAFVALAAWLSGTASLWVDEGDTWTTSATTNSYFFDAIGDWDSHAPLYFGVVRAVSVLGDHELVLRLPSIAAGAVVVLLVGRLGRVLAEERGYRIGLLLGCTNALVLYHASEARNYAMTMALGAASTLALIGTTQNESRRAWARYGVLTSLLVLSHTLAMTVVVAHSIWAANEWRRTGRRPTVASIVAWGGIAVTCALMTALLLRISESESSFDPVTYRTPVVLVRDLFGNGSWLPLLPASAAFLWGSRSILVPAAGQGRVAGAPEHRSAHLLVLLTATIPVVLLITGSLVAPSSLAGARYASPAVPAALAVAAAGIAGMAGRTRGVVLAVAVTAGLVAQIQTAADRNFQDFDAAMALVRSTPVQPAAVAYFDSYSAWTGAYYLRDVPTEGRPSLLVPASGFPAPMRLDQPVIPLTELAHAAAQGPAVLWLVVRQSEAAAREEAYGDFLEVLAAAGYETDRSSEFTGLTVVELHRTGADL